MTTHTTNPWSAALSPPVALDNAQVRMAPHTTGHHANINFSHLTAALPCERCTQRNCNVVHAPKSPRHAQCIPNMTKEDAYPATPPPPLQPVITATHANATVAHAVNSAPSGARHKSITYTAPPPINAIGTIACPPAPSDTIALGPNAHSVRVE
jgi:hypothetical protein